MRYVLLFVSIAACNCIVLAQIPQAELFGGYTYGRHGPTNLNGWNGSFTKSITERVGITGEVSGHYTRGEFTITEDHEIGTARLHSFRVGPRFHHHPIGSRSMAFGHVLAGGTHFYLSGRAPGGRGAAGHLSETGFSFVAGAAVDVRISSAVALRLFQADFESFRRSHHDFDEGLRLSFGVVLRSH